MSPPPAPRSKPRDRSTIAALVVEPMTGSSGGAIVPPDGYLPGVRALCDEFGILLIIDEVMTGFGRTGPKFGVDHWDVRPDILVVGQGPGAAATRRSAASSPPPSRRADRRGRSTT